METLFTLLGNIILPVVAIIIAIWSSRQTSKDATRQIESIKQLEKKQIDLIGVQSKTAESIKRLTEIQIEAKLRQIEVEIQKNKLLGQQVREEWQEIENIRKPQLGRAFEDDMKRKLVEQRPRKQMEFYDTYIQNLNEISDKLAKLKEKLK
ncbi:MAG: hypothetical protein ACLTZT_01125 [Butyricimonas faecalis]|jgi:hypothetical protein|uniref:hypothetical protein n=1 Tax=Butyricimonas faecalis TaxID=2093856 RepID=UPI001D2667DD|nr:hypothetical protein [Sanguibacteroides justesenii]